MLNPNRRYSRTLTYYRMPMAVLSEFTLLVSPLAWTYAVHWSLVTQTPAELVALAARHGGPEALGEVAGRVESRWIERRLEPLKEKLAAAEITPEEARELARQLAELQALARSAGGA